MSLNLVLGVGSKQVIRYLRRFIIRRAFLRVVKQVRKVMSGEFLLFEAFVLIISKGEFVAC